MKASFESFRDVLKHPIRRKIILGLSERGRISYVDLMHLVGVSNTGKFNYHLNILGDLIKKDENGRYDLSDKGRLAVQFLREFEDRETEPIPLPMSMKAFETRAFSLAQGFIWVLLVYPLTWILFGWYLYFANRAGFFTGDPTIPLMIFTMIVVAGFALFGMTTFPKIKIDRDGVEVKSGFVRRFFSLEEIRMDSKGYVLKLGEGLTAASWFIPFKEKECMVLLNKHVRTYRSKPLFLMYLLPVLVIGFYFELVRGLGGGLSPLFWAFSWGATAAISMSIFVYGAPADIRMGNLRRGASSMVFGLSTGITIFLLMFLV
ncbi:MAG TPA: winged helix-turn-helix domain-containing protein [Candidatus Bathyarchaeia archaeon]|nr:winged helix-turn-helix domain-containing protein [Candidatus Bathyarchaeia archaeon]